MHRRELVSKLLEAGFISRGGAKHEKFVGPHGEVVQIKRHSEIDEVTAKKILRQAGLK